MNFFAIPFPNINPEIISFGVFSIKWYGLAYIGAIIFGWKYVSIITKNNQNNLEKKDVDDLAVWLTLGIILGGRIGYSIFYQPLTFLRDPLKILEIWNGGMSFHGGLIGVIISIIFFSIKRKKNLFQISDMIALVTPIGLFFGRIANFINQELWGRITNVPWAVNFPIAGNVPRHPSQIYEAIFEGILLYFLLAYLWHFTNSKTRHGYITGVFIFSYSFIRFFVEFYREPDIHIGFIFNVLTMGQLLSLPFMILGLTLIFYSKRNN